MKLISPDLDGTVPKKFTCDGEGINPALGWRDEPEGTKSFAIQMRDPDAPMGTFFHWMVYNIPRDKTTIEQGRSPARAS